MIGKVVRSHRIYDGKVLRFRVDEVRLPDGRVARREVVKHPGAVAIVAFKDHSSILMVKQLRHSVDGWLLEIPAGTLEKGEKPRRCASRELVEETGYKADRMKRMFSCYVAPGYSNELIHEYVAAGLKYVGRRTESDEFMKTITVRVGEAVNMIVQGTIKDAKSICGILYVTRNLPEIESWLVETV